MALLASVAMIATASYAWLVLSESPSVNGISVSIGGGKTILLAPDLQETITDENGSAHTVHYPGAFSDTLNFTTCDSYQYLSRISGLSPVSTVDGQYWVVPSYDENGFLKKVADFSVDETLSDANQPSKAGYICMDFWMVSPGSEYDIRISTDKNTEQGSFLIELPGVANTADGKLALGDADGIVSACARVGFLVNNDTVTENGAMTRYIGSTHYDSRYSSLLGVYQEYGEKASDNENSTVFTVYEPNGDQHTSESGIPDGSYLITRPLGYKKAMAGDGEPSTGTISEEGIDPAHLTVQKQSTWIQAVNGADETQLAQAFQTSIANVAGEDKLVPSEAESSFYRNYLQSQVSSYLTTGLFYKDTTALYAAVQNSMGVADLQTAGASDGAVITTLKRNKPQRIRMFIWLEGQDADCTSVFGRVDASCISLKIEFAGSGK